MIQPSRAAIAYDVKDGSVCWHTYDDSLNIYFYLNGVEQCIEILGIDADAVFQLARNAMCANDNCFRELNGNPYQVNMAKEMIEKLQAFVNKMEPTDATHDS